VGLIKKKTEIENLVTRSLYISEREKNEGNIQMQEIDKNAPTKESPMRGSLHKKGGRRCNLLLNKR
jgi:hypothetical protein